MKTTNRFLAPLALAVVPLATLAPPASAIAEVARPVPSWPGELAYVRSTTLYVGAAATGFAPVRAGAGQPVGPQWSPDGKWLAFETSGTAAPYSALWVVGRRGGGARRVSASGAEVLGFSWRPGLAHDQLAYYSQSLAASQSVLDLARAGGGPQRLLVRARNISGFAWSPNGTQVAVSTSSYGPNGFSGAALELQALAGGSPRALAKNKTSSFLIAGWLPDDKGLLYWLDPDSSASIAADGVALYSEDVVTHRAKPLATTLLHPRWVAPAPGGGQVALVAGQSRSVWTAGRHVEVCDPVSGKCRAPRPLGARAVTLSPVWQGRTLVYAAAPASDAAGGMGEPAGAPRPESQGADFGPGIVKWWYGSQRLWSEVPGHAGPVPVAGAGPGSHDPVGAGNGLIFVRGSSLYYLSAGRSVQMTASVGPASPYANSYYGYVDWTAQFAWAQGPVQER